jgi:hypothetical protein
VCVCVFIHVFAHVHIYTYIYIYFCFFNPQMQQMRNNPYLMNQLLMQVNTRVCVCVFVCVQMKHSLLFIIFHALTHTHARSNKP